jgi:uncharacterized protein YecE (DUF72 family)
MDFGKLPFVDGIDFTLPPDHPDTAGVLQESSAEKTQWFLGSPVWAEKSWAGKIYPLKVKEKDFLTYYSQYTNSIELNSTYHHVPDLETVHRWRESSAAGFRFCPKVPGFISQSTDIRLQTQAMLDFCSLMQHLEEKLGMLFLQLPPRVDVQHLQMLLPFLMRIPAGISLALELRHESWFTVNAAANELFAFLKDRKISMVISDVSGRRDVLHQRLTTDRCLVRFNGNNLHPTDFPRLQEWYARIQNWSALGLAEVYFFLHSPDRGLYPQMAQYFYGLMGRETKWPFEQEVKPQQGSLFD